MTHRPNAHDGHHHTTSFFGVDDDDDDDSHYRGGDWTQQLGTDSSASSHHYRPRHLSTTRSFSLPVPSTPASPPVAALPRRTSLDSVLSEQSSAAGSNHNPRRPRRHRSNTTAAAAAATEAHPLQLPPLVPNLSATASSSNKGPGKPSRRDHLKKKLSFSRTSTSTSLKTRRNKPQKHNSSPQSLKRTISNPPPSDFLHRGAHNQYLLAGKKKTKKKTMDKSSAQQSSSGKGGGNDAVEETATGTVHFIRRGSAGAGAEGAPSSTKIGRRGSAGAGAEAMPSSSTTSGGATTSGGQPPMRRIGTGSGRGKGQRRGLSPLPPTGAGAVGGGSAAAAATSKKKLGIRRSQTLETGTIMPSSLFAGVPSKISTATAAAGKPADAIPPGSFSAPPRTSSTSSLPRRFKRQGTAQQQQQNPQQQFQQQQQHHLHVQSLRGLIPGAKANTSNLLDDDSDLSDPDDNDDHHDDDTPSHTNRGGLSPASFQRNTVSFGSTSTMHHQAAAAAAASTGLGGGSTGSGGLLGDLSNPDDSFRGDWEHRDRISSIPPLGSYSQYLNEGDDAVGGAGGGSGDGADNDSLIPSATELARVVSVNLFDSNRRLRVTDMDSSSNYNQQIGTPTGNKRSFLGRMFGRRRQASFDTADGGPSSFSSKTMWKNRSMDQVPDQSINLMDMENAVRQEHNKRKKMKKKAQRPSLLNQMMEASINAINYDNNSSDDDPSDQQPLYQQLENKRKKKRKQPPKKQEPYFSVSCCSAMGIICSAIAAAAIMVLSLVYAGSINDNTYFDYNATEAPSLAATTDLPSPNPSQPPTLIPTTAPAGMTTTPEPSATPSIQETAATPKPSTASPTSSAPTPRPVSVSSALKQAVSLSNGITGTTKVAAKSVVPHKKAAETPPAPAKKVAPSATAAKTPPHDDVLTSMDAVERERWEGMINQISTNDLTSKDKFDDPESSPYKALAWMMTQYYNGDEVSSSSSSHLLEDGASSAAHLMGMGNMDYISSDSLSVTKFLEHYALMVFWFATHPTAQPGDAKTYELSTRDHESETTGYDPNNDWIHHARTHPCHWDGIHCGHLKRVVFLNLTQHELHGTLPEELKALGHLKSLDLSRNSIQGTMPAVLGEMDRLHVISLHDNDLEGTIPDLSALTHLETLELGNNPRLIGPLPEL